METRTQSGVDRSTNGHESLAAFGADDVVDELGPVPANVVDMETGRDPDLRRSVKLLGRDQRAVLDPPAMIISPIEHLRVQADHLTTGSITL